MIEKRYSASLLLFIFVSMAISQRAKSQDLPTWVHNSDPARHIVAKTEKFAAKLQVVENRLPAARHALTQWANETCGADCVRIINAFSDEDLDALIDNEHIEPIRTYYDSSDSNELSGQWDEFYRGHFQIRISEDLHQKIQKAIVNFQLRHRLALTLVTSIFSLGVGAILWSYLTVTKLTRGFYVSRFRWIAGAMLATLIGVCYCVSLVAF